LGVENWERGLGRIEAGISKNYCATKNSGSPEIELRFCPWLIFSNIELSI
jgi:hypothetical protein